MDEWQFLEPYWDGSSEAQRRQPSPANPAPVPGELPSFGYPTDTRFSPAAATLPNNFDVSHPTPLISESFQTGASKFHSTPDSWDASAYSWPAQFSEQPRETVHDALVIQPHWDDFIASLQTAPTRPPSTGSSAGDFSIDGYGIDILMADMGDEYSSLGFPSVPPSSIPDDDGYSSRSSRPVSAAPSSIYDESVRNSPPSISVEISAWDSASGSSEDPFPALVPVREPELDLLDEVPDMDARLGWQWKPSDVKWLDRGVSSDVVEFPSGIPLTDKQTIYAVHRVKGCPSQFPFYPKRTAFLIDFTDIHDLNPGKPVDSDIRDQDSHSWGGSSGSRSQVDAHLPGSFFGLGANVKIACRRANPKCGGVAACDSLDPAFLNEERRELDPEPSRKLAAAMLRTREMQDDTEVGRTIAFHHSLQNWRCNGVHTDGTRCDGSISLHKLNTPDRNKNHILLCSNRRDALTMGSFHSQTRIFDQVSEELFVKVMNGEPIIDEDDNNGKCSRVVSARTGAKGRSQCPFNHHKNGLPHVAQVQPVTCAAKMHIYCPWESLHPELARMAVVVPSPDSGHTHPPPPNNKCTHAVAERYRECVRKIGLGATVAKVENAQTTKDLLDGKTPSLFHPGLISRDTKTRLIQQVKHELNEKEVSVTAANARQQVAAYLAEQEGLSDEKKYLHSSFSRDGKRIIFGAHHKLLSSIHDLRTLDCDTTFKPVAGEMQIFEINGWLVGINESVTVMRIWMEIHDRKAYKSVWEEVQRLVLKLTRKPLKFKGLHKGGKNLGLNADMEAAPLLGFADAFISTIDLEDVRSVVGSDPQELLSFVLRICYTHFNRGIPKLLHLSNETRKHIFDLKYAKTVEEVEAFKAWILTLLDPDGVLKRWWDHKLMHRWLLRGIIQCLSNIPLEQWNTMEATTNLGEAQHAWNNAQTGISMGVIESFKKYEELDIRRAEEIEIRKSTAVPRNARNEVSQRYATRSTRQARNANNARRAHAADSNVAALEAELSETREEVAAARSDAKAEPSPGAAQRVRGLEATVVELEGKLKLARAEAKSNSSGRVRASRAGASTAMSTTPASASGPSGAPAADAALPIPPVAAESDAMDPDTANVRRVSARHAPRKRAQPEPLTEAAPASSNKRRKKLEDPLAGWVMQDPDTGEQLSGHEWVKRYPEEFEERYKKDHSRYIEYLAQVGVDF
ncbi:hypothetical protein DFH08DRAFT_884920 [Mycena albidolilacea]|uniref:Uncharacterized protein n=1 Tax=Mycena albidolilacea TaxID=1033008 RepID=A0AAD7EJS3_9AGAR|nr:hypothetical protein DFH08DRAFT_884920 [Mycena albidolilacea]